MIGIARPDRLWAAVAVGLTLVALFPALGNGWTNWDDVGYVIQNPLVVGDLSEQFSAIWTEPVMGNYHPLTVLSLSIDNAIGAFDAPVYHLTSLLLHLLTTLLVFMLLRHFTTRPELAALGAALFGLHPMHVEAVAWISSRKDVLYGLFFVAGLLSWLRYMDQRTTRAYVFTLVWFALALLSKGVAVVFPAVLVLLDWYAQRSNIKTIFVEKLPFAVLAIVFSWIAFSTQSSAEAIGGESGYTIVESIAVASHNLCMYLAEFLIPVKLSPYHPHPVDPDTPLPAYFYFFLLIIPAIAIVGWMAIRKKQRLVAVGLGTFLVCLLPVLQLIPLGNTIMAERYTYIAYIGLLLIVIAAANRWMNSSNERLVLGVGLVGSIALGVVSFNYSATWRNSETLWTQVIETYPNDFLAYGKRASHFEDHDNDVAALGDWNSCLERNDVFAAGYNNRGLVNKRLSNRDAAIRDFGLALQLEPQNREFRMNRAATLAEYNLPDQALPDVEVLVAQNPNDPVAHLFHGVVYEQLGQNKNALADYNAAIQLDAANAGGYVARGKLLFRLNDLEPALKDFKTACDLNPNYAEAWYRRSLAEARLGKQQESAFSAATAKNLGWQ